MDTIPDDEVRRLRLVLRALAGLSALVHGALCVYCLVKHVAAPHGFALHHTRVSARLTNASNASNASNACPAPSFAVERVDHTVDGWLLLACDFLLALAAQCFYAYTTFNEQALETFRQPCLVRWLERAATTPLELALVAMCVRVRDVHTLALLAAAQTASVLVGFALASAQHLHTNGTCEAHTHT